MGARSALRALAEPHAQAVDIIAWALDRALLRRFGEVYRVRQEKPFAASTRSDPQAKSLGEFVRAKLVDIPRSLLPK